MTYVKETKVKSYLPFPAAVRQSSTVNLSYLSQELRENLKYPQPSAIFCQLWAGSCNASKTECTFLQSDFKPFSYPLQLRKPPESRETSEASGETFQNSTQAGELIFIEAF